MISNVGVFHTFFHDFFHVLLCCLLCVKAQHTKKFRKMSTYNSVKKAHSLHILKSPKKRPQGYKIPSSRFKLQRTNLTSKRKQRILLSTNDQNNCMIQ